MICEKCGKEYEDTSEGCPFCQEEAKVAEEKPSAEDERSEELAGSLEPEGNTGDVLKEASSAKAAGEATLEALKKGLKFAKSKNYDFVTKNRSYGKNVYLKTLIVGVIMLILTVGIGTFAYIQINIKHDSAARTSGLIAKGATVGVSKGTSDGDIGAKFYVSGVNEAISLRSAPSQDEYEALESLTTGTVVIVKAKTSASFWQVQDFATEIVGYVSPTFLSKDESKIIALSNEGLSSTLGFNAKEDKIKKLCYVMNAGEGVSLYSTKMRKEGSEIATLTDGNTVGVTDGGTEDVFRVYDYRSSQYGFMESKYLTENFDDILAAQQSPAPPAEEEEAAADEKQGPEYYDSWSESGLSVRDGPTKENGQQVDRIEYGDVVQLIEKTNEDFWYVYIPQLDIYGYVRSTCLTPVDEKDTEPYENAKKTESKN